MLVSSPLRSSSRSSARALPGATLAPFPAFIQPCLALPRTEVPTARGLVHELKLDGYRVQAHIRDGRVRLYTRRERQHIPRLMLLNVGNEIVGMQTLHDDNNRLHF